MKNKQKGFALIESLLLLVIVILIAGTGYYAWHSQKQADKNLNDAVNASQNAPNQSAAAIKTYDECAKATSSKIKETYPPICVTKDGKQFPQTSSNSSQKYVTIKEWGVRATYSGDITLDYQLINDNTASLSSKELELSDPNCKSTYSGYGGVIIREAGESKQINQITGQDTGMTVAQYAKTLDSSTYGVVGNYYFFFEHPQAACGQSKASNLLQNQTINTVESIVHELQAEPQ